MVAAGGGGDSWTFGGGSGGGLIGRTTYSSNSVGTQTSGYAFGKGQNATEVGSSDGVGGGGSGYYGGYAPDVSSKSSGTGGSSFISGYAGVNAITSSSSRVHTNDTLHYSNKYFINTEMKSGVRTGNGKAVITYISKSKPERTNTSLNNVRYVKDCINGSSSNYGNHWVELQAIYNGTNIAKGKSVVGTTSEKSSFPYSRITDGLIGYELYSESTGYNSTQCVTIDLGQTYDLDEVAVWHYWKDGRTYNANYTYTSSDNENWMLVIDKQEEETSEGKRANAYEELDTKDVITPTGGCEQYTVKTTGYYKLEAWGASGGYSLCNGSKCSSEPGKGGYTSGIINLTKGETLYVCVGEKGSDGVKGVNSAGGYNGGGLGTWDNADDETSGGGGGATDIRLVSGTWDSEEGLNSRIMVAAGGGGDSWTFGGGSGGGLIGRTTYSSNSVGTQTSGYAFGKGQNATGVGSSDGVGGGGSGYYGGYATDDYYSAGTGGSSFISGYAGVNAITSSTDRTHTNNTLHYSNKYFINTEMKSGVNTGDGKVTITLISEEKPERKNIALDSVRYIKECLNGSTSSIYNSLGELEAIYNGVNVAKGLIVKLYNADGTEVSGYNSTSFSKMTDGDIGTNDNYGATYSGNQCYVLDLGQTYDLDEIAVWHKWTDGRTYYDNYTYVSSDNEKWTLVIDKQEPETSEGKRVNAYEETTLKINQTKGGTITCTNNTTGQSSISSLPVSDGDSVTCSVNLLEYYELTSLKIENDSINDNKEFIYDYKGITEINATYYCNDTEGPTLTISNSNSGWTFGPVYITATATDPSGVSTIYYRYGSDSTSTKRDLDSSSGSGTTSYTAKGTWSAARNETVYVTAVDALGNSTTKTTTVKIKSCDCMYRSSTYKSVPSWYHSVCSSYHSTAYLHLCYCTDGSIYNCTSSGWSDAGGSGCYVHTGYNTYTGLDYSWSNYSGSYW